MTSPAARQAMLVSQVLEDVLIQMTKLRRKIDRSHPVTTIENALVLLRTLADSAPTNAEHLPLLDSALAATREARIAFENNDPSPEGEPLRKRLFGAQRSLEHIRDGAIDFVVKVQGQARDEANRRVVDPAPFRGSDGASRLHQLSRQPLATGVEAIAPDDWVFDQIDTGRRAAAVGDGPDSDAGSGLLDEIGGTKEADEVGLGSVVPDDAKRLQMFVPIGDNPLMAHGIVGEVAHLARIATQCLEDIGVLGNLRRVDEKKIFVAEAIERFEQRMLSNVDAAASLGTAFEVSMSEGGRFSWGVLDHAMKWAKDAAVPEPGRAFARTLLLCSVEGQDTLRAAVLALKQSHPLTYEMHAEAFALAPNPGVDSAMVALCKDDDPRICAMAAKVLAMRGFEDVAQLLILLEHSNDDVRIAAARCAATAGVETSRQAAVATLIDFVAGEFDDDISVAAIESLVLLGSIHGLKLARERIRADVEEPGYLQRSTSDRLLQLIAIAGEANDSELLTAAYRGDAGAAVALARFGHVDTLPVLMEAFAGGELLAGPKQREAAAEALAYITGAIEQPHPQLGLEPVALPTNTQFWQSWWSDNGKRFNPKLRYRHGEPYTPLQSIDELELVEVLNRDRVLSAFELAVLPETPKVRVGDFVARQRAQLREARLVVESDLATDNPRQPPGAWTAQHLR